MTKTAYNTTKRQDEFTGYIMRGDNITADVERDQIVDATPSAPLYIQRFNDFNGWIKDRGADLQRSYMRAILRRLNLPLLDVSAAVMFVHAAAINDTFWVKERDSDLTYNDVKFSNDAYFKAALCGDAGLFGLPIETTPEITNIGSFNKGWRLIGGKWYLYKSGSALEYFSELFVSALAAELGLGAVTYWMDAGYIVCENFVRDGQCFEPAKSVVGNNIGYMDNGKAMREFGLLKPYLDLIFTDVIVRNADRHEFNYGFITDERGIVSLAPNFDNNVSLFFSGIPDNLTRQDVLVAEFCEVLQYLDTISFRYALPRLDEGVIARAYNQIEEPYRSEVPIKTLTAFCLNAYRLIERFAEGLHGKL